MSSTSQKEAARNAQLTDAAIIASIGGGDLSGLGELFDRYGVEVRRFLGRLGIPASDVDDLVQQTFLDVLHAASRFRPDAPAKPWLFGLAAMVARRYRRTVSQMILRVRKWTREWTTERPPTPAEHFERTSDAGRAETALAMLSHKKREAFVLVSLNGLTGEEAAQVLGVPVATVWTRLHHARRELRAAMVDSE